MKQHLYVCLLALPLSLWAQGTPGAPLVLETGPHHRVLRVTESDEAGQPAVRSWIELGTGPPHFLPRLAVLLVADPELVQHGV